VPLSPGASFSLAKPRSCRGGVSGADDGSVMYSCATSAPGTSPRLVLGAVAVATVSQRAAAPPGMVAPVAGPAVAVEVMARSV
jgi:hypothetical protein